MSESDHEKLPLTEGDVESKTSKCNWPKCNWPKCNWPKCYKPQICKFDPLTCALPAALAFMICILFIVYVAKLIIYEVNYEPPDIPIEIKNFTIICDTWNGFQLVVFIVIVMKEDDMIGVMIDLLVVRVDF
jgi:hypothetical protein